MKKNLILSFAALAAVVACEQEKMPVQNVEPQESKREVTIVANASETKTVLDDEDAVLWESGDKVSLILVGADASTANDTEEFTTEQSGATATFNGKLQNDLFVGGAEKYEENAYVVYPSTAVKKDGSVEFELESDRTVAPGSFPSGMNLSSSAVSLNELITKSSIKATFLNAFAIIRFQVPEDVKSLKITGTAPLSGKAQFAFDTDGRLVAQESDAVSPSVVVTPAEGTEFVAGQTYNLLVLPGEHSSMTVELTDVDNCKYSKTNSGKFTFAAAGYYTFNFNTSFGKDFTFTVTGADVADESKIMAVFNDGAQTNAYESVLNSKSFTVRMQHGVTSTSGYAVYPSSVYSEGKINYTLDANNPAAVGFYWGTISTDVTEVALTGVKSGDFAKLSFTVPAGVATYTVSSDQALYGAAEATVVAGALNVVPTAGAVKSFEGTATGIAQTICVFPLNAANLTVTMYDAAGASYVHSETVTVANGNTATLSIPESFEFGKSGAFGNENFTEGGSYDF